MYLFISDSAQLHVWIYNKHISKSQPKIVFKIFSEIESDEEEIETSSPSKSFGGRSEQNDERQEHSNNAETDHFSTLTFGDPSTSEGPISSATNGGSGKVYDKYYDYYFKYYTDKYGGGTSLSETKSKVDEIGAKNHLTTESNIRQDTVLSKPDSGQKSCLSLVTYSGSEDDE